MPTGTVEVQNGMPLQKEEGGGGWAQTGQEDSSSQDCPGVSPIAQRFYWIPFDQDPDPCSQSTSRRAQGRAVSSEQ